MGKFFKSFCPQIYERHLKNDNRHLLECQTLKNEIADELLIATL